LTIETATLAGGCFWCIEAALRRLNGVETAISGYTAGQVEDPDYRAVCTGSTGHAEAVQVRFNNEVLSYRTLLEVFFTVHDPTTLNRQGADRGTQYRSAIYYHSESQRETAESLVAELDGQGIWPGPIVTEIAPATVFYPAEPYHQDYYAQNPHQGYCQVVIAPKLTKLRERHRALLAH
jgi:peptide-methionine (S)-S-oxide reductase